MRDSEVVVVGAGPAGSTAARLLAESGHEVALMDQRRFPRPKLCAGAISGRALALVPGREQFHPLVREQLYRFTVLERRRVSAVTDEPYGYTVDRSEFDNMLVEEAVSAGALFLPGHHVDYVEQDRTCAIVHVNRSKVRAHVVVRADGAPGFARLNRLASGFGLEAWCARSDLKVVPGPGEAIIRPGLVSGGYSWLIPHGDVVSTGTATTVRLNRNLRSAMNRWLTEVLGGSVGVRVAGHALPATGQARQCAHGRTLVVGDAAGVADPLTGEGLFQAMWTGMAAARAIHLYVAGRESMSVYDRWLHQDMWPELDVARRLHRLIYGFGPLRGWLLSVRPQAVDAFLGVISGKGSYRAVYRELL